MLVVGGSVVARSRVDPQEAGRDVGKGRQWPSGRGAQGEDEGSRRMGLRAEDLASREEGSRGRGGSPSGRGHDREEARR